MKRRLLRWCAALGLLLLLAIAALAQRFGRGGGGIFGGPESEDISIPVREAEFHFVRTEYTDLYRRGFGFVSRRGKASGWWAQDWPDADNHFTLGIQRLTRIDTGDPRHFRLTDSRIFDYPWIYLTQAAYPEFSEAEVRQLREYLLRGGFLVTDDFWGPDEWEVFRQMMERVLPNRPISDIALSDSVMHVFNNIREQDLTFIPGSRHIYGGRIMQPAGTSPAWQAIYDDKNRMVVAINFNTDVGDAWEFADDPRYPAEMTTLAYRYGINYIIYAMTH